MKCVSFFDQIISQLAFFTVDEVKQKQANAGVFSKTIVLCVSLVGASLGLQSLRRLPRLWKQRLITNQRFNDTFAGSKPQLILKSVVEARCASDSKLVYVCRCT